MSPPSTIRIRRQFGAPREAVYRALIDPRAVAAWKAPDGMLSRIHSFDGRDGGTFRISLTRLAAVVEAAPT